MKWRVILVNAHKARKSTNSKVFVVLLGLEHEYESSPEFTAREFSLLKELRAEQLAANQPWSKSEVIATLCTTQPFSSLIILLSA
jgi:hypothetical protein